MLTSRIPFRLALQIPLSKVLTDAAQLISLLYGEGFDIFRPNVPVDHKLYVDKILARFHKYFGPYPASYMDLPGMSPEVLQLLADTMNSFQPGERIPFQRVSRTEISHRDRDFICKIMKMDPRDRPTVRQLLEDEWFDEADAGMNVFKSCS